MFRFAQHTVQKKQGTAAAQPPNCNHFAIGLVIVSKIVFRGFSVDHVEKKLLELFIAGARRQRSMMSTPK